MQNDVEENVRYWLSVATLNTLGQLQFDKLKIHFTVFHVSINNMFILRFLCVLFTFFIYSFCCFDFKLLFNLVCTFMLKIEDTTLPAFTSCFQDTLLWIDAKLHLYRQNTNKVQRMFDSLAKEASQLHIRNSAFFAF